MSPTNSSQSLPEVGFIRQAQLIPAIVPFSNATLWRKVKDGTFPAPVKLSPRVTAWDVRQVRQWIETCAAEAGKAA
ncbi:AlpA family phage regulatory protein [Allosphingosinicella vermicomposti]|uniref:helix-turn-helix transcriptional regulator n=1 Tax=Allosphingosinicella vermicomposti TaxID=614671 RepID=UPI000D10902B